MKEYDYKKEYKKLLDNYNELKSKSNIKSDEKARKFAYKSLVAQNKAKHDIVCKWEKDNDKLFDGTVEDILKIFSLRLNEREDYKEIKIEYKIGIAETFKENQTARKLLSEAIKNKKEFVSQII